MEVKIALEMLLLLGVGATFLLAHHADEHQKHTLLGLGMLLLGVVFALLLVVSLNYPWLLS